MPCRKLRKQGLEGTNKGSEFLHQKSPQKHHNHSKSKKSKNKKNKAHNSSLDNFSLEFVKKK